MITLTAGLALAVPELASTATVTLHWRDNAQGEAAQIIERQDYPGGPFREVGQVAPNVETWEDPAALPGVRYCYRVRAIGPGKRPGLSGMSCLAPARKT
jgi:hypothetical protein